MNEIRAFVGHSFTEDDADLVGKFLQHFERLSKALPNFSWEHAEAAEPKQLSEKVLMLIADKNVFIGICTKKELVVAPTALSSVLLQNGFRKAKESDFHWKTSDWIIQEIGMARARGPGLILLLEDGLRRPGGLQGDVEYISFHRSAPEKAFDKLLEMLSSLSPKEAGPSVASSEPALPLTGEQDTSSSETESDRLVPKPSWGRDNYESAVLSMIFSDDMAGVKTITSAYLATAEAQANENASTWEAHVEYFQLAYGKNGNLARLKEISAAHPNNISILSYLARGITNYGDHADAAAKYEDASNLSVDEGEKAKFLGLAAKEYAKAGDAVKGRQIIELLKGRVEAGTVEEKKILHVLRDFAETTKDDASFLAVLERIVEVTPEDISARFSVGYQHSQSGNSDLALSHYLKIPYNARNQMAWNNLGVAFDAFNLPRRAVLAFQMSEGMGETLAMSNLANKLISSGFNAEAQELCDKALKIDGYNKNILHNLSRLKEIPDEEKKRLEDLSEKIKPKVEFYRSLGRAVSRAQLKSIAEGWRGPDCVLSATLSGDVLTFSGSYEQDVGGLAGLLSGMSLTKQVEKYRVQYSGTVNGRTVNGFVSRTKEGGESPLAATTLLGAAGNQAKVAMIISDDGNEIRVMEDAAIARYYVLKLPDGKPATRLGQV